jgi:L-alanine-DL-glutamate epimerase-like enolase superfamily enzyme
VGGDDTAIRAVRAAAYEIPTDGPESDGTLAWTATRLVVVEVDAGGVTGLGYTYADAAAVPLVTATLAPVVHGRDVLAVPERTDALVRHVRNLGACGLAAMAISALDTAMWDAAARLLDLPLVVALGAAHDSVAIYGSGGFTSYDDRRLSAQLEQWVAEGTPRVKIKVGRDPGADRHRTAVARAAVGPDVALFVDANGAYGAREAIEWAQVFRDEFGVSWFEEPVSSDDVAGLRLVRESAPGGIDIAAGEYSWNLWDVQRLAAGHAVDVMQVDVTRCLGMTGFRAAAAVCDAAQLDVSAHCAPQLSAHALAAARRARHLEWFHDHTRIEAMLFDGCLDPHDGTVTPDRSRAGHGLTFKREDARRFRIA